jgi:peptidoglycan/LPS O-acetylase OafA/YrhL
MEDARHHALDELRGAAVTPLLTQAIFEAPIIRGRSNGIDALRAIFALWVVIAHLVPRTYQIQGADKVPGWLYYFTQTIVGQLTQASGELHPAVLGFIVLSGYCIHRNGLRDDAPDVRKYATRRAFRILPVFWLACALPLITLPIDSWLDAAKTLSSNGATTVFPVCLFAKATTLTALTSYFDWDGCSGSGNGPLVTVAVEIWLYIIYAVVFALFVRASRQRVVLAIMAVSFAVTLGIAFALGPSADFYNWWQNSSIGGFLPYWWLGAVLVAPGAMTVAKRLFVPLLLVWIVLTAAILYGFDIGSGVAELRKLVFAIGIGGIIGWLESAAIADNPLSLIGRAGYSVYAFHSPLVLLLVLLGLWWPLTLAIIVAFGLGVYVVVEKPMIELGRRRLAAVVAS